MAFRDVSDMEVAYDAHDMVQDRYGRNTDDDGCCPSFPYDGLHEVFDGTPVERWHDSMEEW